MGLGNAMIDGDSGSDPRSPYYDQSAVCPDCGRKVVIAWGECYCGLPVDEMGLEDEYFDDEPEPDDELEFDEEPDFNDEC